MTVAEYNLEFARCQRRVFLHVAMAIGALVLALGIAAVLRLLNNDRDNLFAPIVIFTLGVPSMLYGFYRADRVYRQFPALICQHYDGNLSREKSVIIATGNCPRCGRRVLKDEAIGT